MLPVPRPPSASTVWCVPAGAIGRIPPIYVSFSTVAKWRSEVFSVPGSSCQSAVMMAFHSADVLPPPVLDELPVVEPDPVPVPAPVSPVPSETTVPPQPARTIAAPKLKTHAGAFLIFVPPVQSFSRR